LDTDDSAAVAVSAGVMKMSV